MSKAGEKSPQIGQFAKSLKLRSGKSLVPVKQQKGYSFVELISALLVGGVITANMAQALVSLKEKTVVTKLNTTVAAIHGSHQLIKAKWLVNNKSSRVLVDGKLISLNDGLPTIEGVSELAGIDCSKQYHCVNTENTITFIYLDHGADQSFCFSYAQLRAPQNAVSRTLYKISPLDIWDPLTQYCG